MNNFELKMEMQKGALRFTNAFHNNYVGFIQFAFSSIVVIVLASIQWFSCDIVLYSSITRKHQLMFHVPLENLPLYWVSSTSCSRPFTFLLIQSYVLPVVFLANLASGFLSPSIYFFLGWVCIFPKMHVCLSWLVFILGVHTLSRFASRRALAKKKRNYVQ